MVLQVSNPSAVRTTQVGYSINGMNCIPTMTVDSSEKSQVVSITNVEQLVGANVATCVQHINMECTSNIISSAQQSMCMYKYTSCSALTMQHTYMYPIPSMLHGFPLKWDRGGDKIFDVDTSSTQNMPFQYAFNLNWGDTSVKY